MVASKTQTIPKTDSISESSTQIRIVFWNVNQARLHNQLSAIASTRNVDVIILNENAIPVDELLSHFRDNVSYDYYIPVAQSNTRFHCFCKNPQLGFHEVHSGVRTSVRSLQLGERKVLFVIVHGVDLRNYDDSARQAYAHTLANDLEFIKTDKGTDEIVVIGDFNMNPYEPGMNLASGFNAMMTKQCTSTKTRTHIGKQYDFYYNPMWGCFGDRTEGPPGTIYDGSNQGAYGWSIFDQVLFHHAAVPLFDNVEILTKAGPYDLCDALGRPCKAEASDHFPILVTLNRGNL